MNIPKYFSQVLSTCLFFLFIIGCQSCGKNESTENNFKYNDNTVRVRLSSEPGRISPLLEPTSYTRSVYDHIFMEMMDFDPVSLEMVPLLVKNKPIATAVNDGPHKGGTAYTYEIRDEAVWDDGTPVTGADVEFTLKLLFAPGLPPYYRSYYEYVKTIEIDPSNPKKFTITTNKKYILNEPAISNTFVYQEGHYDPKGVMKKFSYEQLSGPEGDKLKDNEELLAFTTEFKSPKFTTEVGGVVGCGPYKFAKREAKQYILLTKKENWWGEKFAGNSPQMQAYPDSIMFKIIPDQAAALTALKDQEVDATVSIDSKDFVDLRENKQVKDAFNLHSPQTQQIFLIYLNTRLPKLADPRVRRALAHLMDVDGFLESLYYGFGSRVTGPVLSHQPYYNKSLKLLEYNVEKAKTILAEAGWADADSDGVLEKMINGEKVDMELEVLIGSSKAVENIAIFYQNSLKKAGIKLDIVKKGSKEAINLVRKGEYELYPGAVGNDLIPFDPKEQWHSTSSVGGGRNYTGFGNAMTDALIDSIRVTLNQEARHNLYKVIQEELYKETPAVFLFSPQDRIAIHKRFDAKISTKRPGYHPNTFKLKK